MKNAILTLSAITLAIVSGAAFADSGRTLEQSQAAYIAARNNGELATGFVNLSEAQIHSGAGAAIVKGAPKPVTLSQDDAPQGFVGHSARDLFPGNYVQAKDGVTREQVRAEMIAARKAGELPVGFVARSERDIYSPAPQGEDTSRYASHGVSEGVSMGTK
jgi:hypothetical protein